MPGDFHSSLVGLSRSAIWRLVRASQFPSLIRISRRAVGWRASEIDAWLRLGLRDETENNDWRMDFLDARKIHVRVEGLETRSWRIYYRVPVEHLSKVMKIASKEIRSKVNAP